MGNKVALIILDGWGIAENPDVSAIDEANISFYPYLLANYPHTYLNASEESVGLPAGQMGNSEVGHINIGAGRVVHQELARISRAISDGSFADNPVFRALCAYCRKENKPLHIMGLVSDGGVHSSVAHLYGILDILKAQGFPNVYLHVFTDGRDTDPRSGLRFLTELTEKYGDFAPIASVCGRYYAMDRDKRWERTQKEYNLLINGEGERFATAVEGIEAMYARGITDEFIEPFVVGAGKTIQADDAVLNFNFRTDRNRQISVALTQEDFPQYGMHKIPLRYATMNRYDKTYQNVEVLFERQTLSNTLGETLAAAGRTQLRIAETEKYPHVTFFFNGGREEPFEGEKRIMIPSPKVATYDLAPEMSAYKVKEAVVAEIEAQSVDFICLNYANADMVGHTGVFEAAEKACQTVDACLAETVRACLANGYAALIIADHGNADKMKNEDGSPHTAHTLAHVPCILVTPDARRYRLSPGVLGDVAPTVLALMGLPQPREMTGRSLLTPLAEPVLSL